MDFFDCNFLILFVEYKENYRAQNVLVSFLKSNDRCWSLFALTTENGKACQALPQGSTTPGMNCLST